MVIDNGGYVYEQPSCNNCSIWLDAWTDGVWVNRAVREVVWSALSGPEDWILRYIRTCLYFTLTSFPILCSVSVFYNKYYSTYSLIHPVWSHSCIPYSGGSALSWQWQYCCIHEASDFTRDKHLKLLRCVRVNTRRDRLWHSQVRDKTSPLNPCHQSLKTPVAGTCWLYMCQTKTLLK